MKLNNFIMMAGLILVVAVFTSFVLPSVSASLGTFKRGSDVNLIQTCNNCTYCNITSASYPNSSNFLTNKVMTQDGTYFNFTLNSTYTDTVGWHKYCYDCGNAAERATGCIDYNINLGGNTLEEGQGFVLLGIFVVIFGIAWIFLFVSGKMAGEGLKIFFLLASFVFLIGALGIIYVMAEDYGLSLAMNSMVSTFLYIICFVTIVMFFYVMIRQTVKALNLFKLRKGYVGYNDDLW